MAWPFGLVPPGRREARVENGVETYRSLSQLESEIKRAERAYIKADVRYRDTEAVLKEAELQFLDAQDERDAALQALNDCHSDLDRTVVMLREASPIGCDWRNQSDRRATAMPLRAIENIETIEVEVMPDFMLKD
jgi:hypothetical protein